MSMNKMKQTPTFAYVMFAFEPHGERPHIYNPEPGVAMSEQDADIAVASLYQQGIHAWYIKRSIYHWAPSLRRRFTKKPLRRKLT